MPVGKEIDPIPAPLKKGAWMVEIVYSGRNFAAKYPDKLPDIYKRRVVHAPAVDRVVECPIYGVGSGESVPGAKKWDPDYTWPIKTVEIQPIEAPTEDKLAFIAAVQTLLSAINLTVTAHIKTHSPDADSLMIVYNELLLTMGGLDVPPGS